MFKSIRDLSGSLRGLLLGLEHISEVLTRVLEHAEEQGPVEERVSELERDRNQWEARVEAELIRSGSQFKSARAAEERAKTVLRNAEALTSGDESEEGLPAEYLELLRRNAEAGEEEGVHQVPVVVAVNGREQALRAKFGSAG